MFYFVLYFFFSISAIDSSLVRFQQRVDLQRENLQDVIDGSMAKCEWSAGDQLFVSSGLMQGDVPGLFLSGEGDVAVVSCGLFSAKNISDQIAGIQITDGSASSLLDASRELSLHFQNGMAAIGYCSAGTLGTSLLPAESFFQRCTNVFFEFDQLFVYLLRSAIGDSTELPIERRLTSESWVSPGVCSFNFDEFRQRVSDGAFDMLDSISLKSHGRPQADFNLLSWHRLVSDLVNSYSTSVASYLTSPVLCSNPFFTPLETPSYCPRCSSQLLWIGMKLFELKHQLHKIFSMASFSALATACAEKNKSVPHQFCKDYKLESHINFPSRVQFHHMREINSKFLHLHTTIGKREAILTVMQREFVDVASIRMLEIGVSAGETSVFLLEHEPRLYLVGADPYIGDREDALSRSRLVFDRYRSRSTLVLQAAQNLSHIIPPASLDIIFFDYEYFDLQDCFGWLKSGAILLTNAYGLGMGFTSMVHHLISSQGVELHFESLGNVVWFRWNATTPADHKYTAVRGSNS